MRVRADVPLFAWAWLAGCGGSGAAEPRALAEDPTCRAPLELSFVPDAGDADEAYLCFGFDASSFAAGTVSAVRWNIASDGAFLVHHAILYAVRGQFPDGPELCDAMPEGATELHVWSPGGDDLSLPPDTGLELPAGVERFALQVHTRRVGTGTTAVNRTRICGGPHTPANLAALMGMGAPVPAIRPRHTETSATTCALAGDLHLYSVWPHMHLVGREIELSLVASDGATTSLIDVAPWDFHRQRSYPLDVEARSGDNIELGCVWENSTDEYVLPGPYTTDEMCTAAFIAWPAAGARCD